MLGDHCDVSAIRCDGTVVYLIYRNFSHALRAKAFAHDRVVHELAENCERCLLCHLFGLRNGVAYAETHSEMLS